jgi:hypothetical protein
MPLPVLKHGGSETDPPRSALDHVLDERPDQSPAGPLDAAGENFRSVVGSTPLPWPSGFRFQQGLRVINELGQTLFERQAVSPDHRAIRDTLLAQAAEQFERH